MQPTRHIADTSTFKSLQQFAETVNNTLLAFITLTFIRRLAWTTVGFTYILVSLGVTVRANNAGLSCPDWPLCYGRLIYTHDYGALLEEIHRWVAGLVSILIIALTLSILLKARKEKYLVIPALLAPVILIIQIVLGGLTVLWKLYGPIITSHLAVAQALFASIIVIAVMASAHEQSTEPREQTRKFAFLAITTAVLVYGLILSGSYVFNSGASLACTGWPLCGAAPDWAVRFHLSDINMLHRYIATSIGLVLIWTLLRAWQRRSIAPGQARIALAVGVFFICQSAVGALVVLWNKPIYIAILHLALATAVWGGLVILAGLAVHQLRVAPQNTTD